MQKIENPHSISKDELLNILNVKSGSGLEKQELKKRLDIFGYNIAVSAKDKNAFDILIKQFKNPLVLILLVAVVLSAAFSSFLDAFIILLALLVNVAIGFLQERKAGRIFEALSKHLDEKVTVLRDASKVLIDSKELVPGDIVLLEAGKKIPADLRVLESQNLKVDESALTGESEPVEKRDCICPENTALHERENMLYAGTLILDGMAKAVVVYTAEDTEFGKIAKESKTDDEEKTPVQKKVEKLSRVIAGVMIIVSIVIVTLAYMQGLPASELLLLVIALAVASVPEGLPAAIAATLAVGMERVLKHGGLVKYPAAAEALGSVDYILTDKTGTLTSGQMNLVKKIAFECIEKADCSNTKDKDEIIKAAVLASDAYLEKTESGVEIHGRPIERAIIEDGIKQGFRQDDMFENLYTRLDFIPFSSARRFAVSLNKDPKFGSIAYLSGAPETLIEKASFVYIDGESVRFTDEMKKRFLDVQSELSAQAFRLTAVAKVHTDSLDMFKSEKGEYPALVFLGLMVFEDEVRDSAVRAVKDAQNMGTEVLMLTGDNKDTALAIAKRVNIASENEQVILGTDFENLNDKEILKAVQRKDKPLRVFARMLPRHKKHLIKVLQKGGFAVAMTGDGINDAPALSLANIGIAVESGTDVAKSAADMILLKSSFESISFAIKEGRRVLINIYKTIVYLLSTSVSETILIGVALSFGGPLPLLPSQLLWHNLIEGGLMNFPFAFDKEMKNTDILSQNKKDFERRNYIFAAYLAILFSSLLLFAYAFMLYMNFSIEAIRTVLFVTFSTSGFFLALSLRNIFKPVFMSNLFSNPYLNIALAVNIFLLLVAFILEPLRNILGIEIPGKAELVIILFIALVKWIGIELIKFFLFILPSRRARKNT